MNKKRGFTIVELLVVIAVIGSLMAALGFAFFGSTESARNAQCLTNLSNLAQAVQSKARDHHFYPLATSVERMSMDESSGIGKGAHGKFSELSGWISWNSRGVYRSHPRDHVSSAGWFISTYNQDETIRDYCITNGSLWRYVNRSRKTYTCPNHIRKMPSSKKPNWSYVMNTVFGWDYSVGGDFRSSNYEGEIYFTSFRESAKTLLFAELQWEDFIAGVKPDYSDGSGTINDCALQFRTEDGGECIGFNHKSGNDIVAHIVFADRHTDVIRYPRNGLSQANLRELTEFLCEGRDYNFDGKKYTEAK